MVTVVRHMYFRTRSGGVGQMNVTSVTRRGCKFVGCVTLNGRRGGPSAAEWLTVHVDGIEFCCYCGRVCLDYVVVVDDTSRLRAGSCVNVHVVPVGGAAWPMRGENAKDHPICPCALRAGRGDG